MFAWIKELFTNPKSIITFAIGELDLLVPLLATELDKAEADFVKLTPTQQSQWIIDKIKAFLASKFGIVRS